MWDITQVDGGWQVTWEGYSWGGVKPTKAAAEEYLDRVSKRWPNGVGALVRYGNGPKSRRGGPYRYRLPEGDWPIKSTGIIEAGTIKEARAVLARWLGRQRLPAGTTFDYV